MIARLLEKTIIQDLFIWA